MSSNWSASFASHTPAPRTNHGPVPTISGEREFTPCVDGYKELRECDLDYSCAPQPFAAQSQPFGAVQEFTISPVS